MKAPNGKPTNLTERQWVQVRTPSFKAWFGDWELSRKADLIFNGEPVSKLTGEEFKKDKISLVNKVADYFKDMGGKVYVQGVGDVVLNKQSVRDSLSHGLSRDKAAAFKAVPNILTQGEIIEHQENWKGRGYGSFTISAPILIRDERFIAVAIINQTRDETKNHFYLHEVALQENLQRGELKTGSFTRSPRGDIRNLIHKLQKSKSNTSKVLDENGEPLVVYHGTTRDFDSFNPEIQGDTDYGYYGKGFYFSSAPYSAEQYASVWGKTLEGGNIKPVFLNIRKPVKVTRTTVPEQEDHTQLRKSKGYDGVIVSEYLTQAERAEGLTTEDFEREYVAYNPNQIKSATDNTGAFSPEDARINFSVSPTVRRFLDGDAVSSLSGKEFQKSGKSLIDTVGSWFLKKYNGEVESPEIGKVVINRRGVKNSISHGLGKTKASAFASVPDVLIKGKLIAHEENWKGRGYEGYVIAAPIDIANKGYVAAVVVNKDSNSSWFYLHEVFLKEKLQRESFKTEALTTNKGALIGDFPSGAIFINIMREIYSDNDKESFSTAPDRVRTAPDRVRTGQTKKESALKKQDF